MEGGARNLSPLVFCCFFTGVGKRLEREESIKAKIMHELTLPMEEEELKVNRGKDVEEGRLNVST